MPLGTITAGHRLLSSVGTAAFLALVAYPDLTGTASGAAPDSRAHWAFQSVRAVTPPVVQQSSWVATPIDQFILARLESEHLRPAAPATREQLLRRVYFDLIGLPPTPAEIDDFVADPSADAWPRVVDRLLASPHYGERWARHWLDVVRYAESDGFEHDAVRPNSWRYRDYVIRSFNEDKPYDRFVQEQVAGDELWPDDPDAVIATAFNLLGPDMVDSADQTQRRLLTLSDMTDSTATTFLGLTLGCARCHDHKLEPFTQIDYYSLQAYFAPARFHRDLAVPTLAERRRHTEAMTEYQARAGKIQQQLTELETPAREGILEEKLGQMSEDVRRAHRTPRDQRTPAQESSVLETAPQLQVTDAEVVKALAPPERSRRTAIMGALKKIPKPSPLPATLALQNTNGPIAVTRVLLRGDYTNPAQAVEPTVPAVFTRRSDGNRLRSDLSVELAGQDHRTNAVHRATLARWLTDPENPLTARVMVNRIWQHHFGRGLVATPNDFGTQGARPTHPELLDWLAREWIARGWSIKALHRLILLSATYRQSSETEDATRRADPDNRWFSRQNRVRLEGEALRDSLLQISGQLDLRVGGASVQPPIAADIVKTSKNWTTSADSADHRRRSVYIFARRNLRYPFLEVFDAPDSNLSCPERGQSTTAPQSLTLLNSREVTVAARETARRLKAKSASEERDDDAFIERAFRQILGRRPDDAELRTARAFIQTTRDRQRQEAQSRRNPGESIFASAAAAEPGLERVELCRALFNLNDFVYVD